MTRKRKIQFAVAAIALAIIAWIFWLENFSGGLWVDFGHASPGNSNVVSFFITNSCKHSVVYYIGAQRERNGTWGPIERGGGKSISWGTDDSLRFTNYTGKILGRSAETVDVRFDFTNQWHLVVTHADSWSASSLYRKKLQLARYASAQGWNHLSQLLNPASGFVSVPGPTMLGNKPVAAESK